MTRYIALRLVRAIATLWLVVTLVFFGMRLAGDPIRIMLGDSAHPEDIERIRVAYGLDQSFIVQYFKYIFNLLQGDLGQSLAERRPVTAVLQDRLPATLQLTGISMFAALLIGIPAGVIAAVRRNSAIDRFIVTVSFTGQAVPGFFIAIILIMVFSVSWGVLPSSGRGGWEHLVLPVIALAWGSLASVARITRVAMLEVINADYVRTARAKGLHSGRIMIWHMLRTALMPVLTMIGFMLAGAVAGAILVETVFAWPGMGRVLQASVMGRDFPVIQAVVMLIALAVVSVNLIVDILYGVIDPRISRS